MATAVRKRRSATGRFATREQLTCHVWAIQRQQVYPNVRAIALACGATMDVVKAIIANEEGLADYLNSGCLTGD
jgi:hypothetical protein